MIFWEVSYHPDIEDSHSLRFVSELLCFITTEYLLTATAHDQHSVWLAAAGYAGLVFFGQGLISWLRYWLWLPIEQFGQQSLLVAAHSHVMNLSCDFHDSKESFQIHQAVAQGAHVTSIVETVCFEIFPMLVDLCLATAYLYWLFGPYLSLTVACTALAYIYTTSKLVSMSNDKRRMSNALLLRQWRSGFESIDGWVTASLFNNLKYERKQFPRPLNVLELLARNPLTPLYRRQILEKCGSAAGGFMVIRTCFPSDWCCPGLCYDHWLIGSHESGNISMRIWVKDCWRLYHTFHVLGAAASTIDLLQSRLQRAFKQHDGRRASARPFSN